MSRGQGTRRYAITPEQWDALVAAAGGWRHQPRRDAADVGLPYRPVPEDRTRETLDTYTTNPEAIERANNAHMATQNALAESVRARGLKPLRPRPGEPQYDLAWWDGGVLWVAEVKSLTDANEESQLRGIHPANGASGTVLTG